MVRRRADPVRGDDRLPARLPRARALPLHGRGRGPAAAAAAARARDRPAGQRRLPRRRDRADLVPAGGVRQDRDRHLPRRVPARHAAAARPGLAPLPRRDDPAAEALRPAARRLGRRDGDARLHPRPRLVADVLRRLPRAALRGDEPALVRDRSASGCSRSAPGSSPTPSGTCRTASTPGATRSTRQLYDGAGRLVPDRAVAVRAGRRRPVRHRLRPGADHAAGRRVDPAGPADRPDLRRDHERARAGGRVRAAARLPDGRRARLQDRDARAATRSPSCSPPGSPRSSRCRCS